MAAATETYLAKLAAVRGEALVVTTMTPAKVWPTLSDSVLDFGYLPSAMSHAADIALGLALARPERTVVCVNGDGSLLMNLGCLVTAAQAGARNLVMLVVENGVYDVVGGGSIPGAGITDFPAMARAAGWPLALRFEDAEAFAAALPKLLAGPGPALASLVVTPEPPAAAKLPPAPGQALRALRAHLSATRG